MQYVISFLEGIITFISPCLLPMLPIYISYFAGGGERTTRKTLLGALGFVSGFSVIFVAMGALAGTIGSFLREYQTMVNVISGLVVILFGLNFLGIFKWNLFRGGGKTVNSHEMGFFSAMLFGMVFSLGWTPCVGAFLGSALMLASQQGHVIEGMFGEDAAKDTLNDVNSGRVSEKTLEKYLYTDETKEEYAQRLKDEYKDLE